MINLEGSISWGCESEAASGVMLYFLDACHDAKSGFDSCDGPRLAAAAPQRINSGRIMATLKTRFSAPSRILDRIRPIETTNSTQ